MRSYRKFPERAGKSRKGPRVTHKPRGVLESNKSSQKALKTFKTGSSSTIPGKCWGIPREQEEIHRRVLKPCGASPVLPRFSGMCSLLPIPGLALALAPLPYPGKYFGSTTGFTVGGRGTASQHRGEAPKSLEPDRLSYSGSLEPLGKPILGSGWCGEESIPPLSPGRCLC